MTPQHLLLGVLRVDRGIIGNSRSGPTDLDQLTEMVESALRVEEKVRHSVDVPISASLEEVFRIATGKSEEQGHRSVEVGHLVLAMLECNDPVKGLLDGIGVSVEEVRGRLD